MIHIENLVKRYQELVALDHFTLTIEEGEIFGLLGPNGSGKTTAINCLLSLLKYDKGIIEVFGQPMAPDNYQEKQQIANEIQRDLNQEEQSTMQPILSDIMKAIQRVRQEKGLDIILEQGAVVNGGIDITSEVSQQLAK